MFVTQMTRLPENLLLLLLIAFCSAPLLAATKEKPIQSRDSIRETARTYAMQLAQQQSGNEKIEIKVGNLDKRLKLAKCSKPVTAFESPNTKRVGRTTVGVRCDGEHSWKIYVSVNIQVMRNVVSLKKPVTRNSVLQGSDLQLVEKDIASLHGGYFTSKDHLIGKFTKSSMQAGSIISPAQVKNPLAIKKGALVTILADVGGITVRMKGKALKGGSMGDWISVKNLSSNRRVEGRITDSGVIQVTL